MPMSRSSSAPAQPSSPARVRPGWPAALTIALAGWLAPHGALYASPDAQQPVADKPLDADGAWRLMQSSHWVADGTDRATRVVYVFTDPNCPYCNKLWTDARPWVEGGKVQLRHILVGILTPSSPGKAAAVLADKHPAALLAAYERSQMAATAQAFASGHLHPLGNEGLKPLSPIPPGVQAQLDDNLKFMLTLGIQATPAVVWRDAKGMIQVQTGVSPQMLPEIMGPR